MPLIPEPRLLPPDDPPRCLGRHEVAPAKAPLAVVRALWPPDAPDADGEQENLCEACWREWTIPADTRLAGFTILRPFNVFTTGHVDHTWTLGADGKYHRAKTTTPEARA